MTGRIDELQRHYGLANYHISFADAAQHKLYSYVSASRSEISGFSAISDYAAPGYICRFTYDIDMIK